MRILIIKTSSMGDIIHCLPVINDILENYPKSQIDWVVEDSFAVIPCMHPNINQVISVSIRRWRKSILKKATWNEINTFKHTLTQYDAVVDCQGLTKSALISLLTKGVRHGFDWHSGRDPFASLFYNRNYKVSLKQDAVARNRALSALALGYEVPSTAPTYGITSQPQTEPKELGLAAKYIVGLHGTSRDSKLWPISKWVELGRALTQKNLKLLLPWASHTELQRANEIASQLSSAIVLPKLNISELASVIAQAEIAIGVDTGLTHLAAALNIPTIAIFTDSNPALNGVIAGANIPAINLGNIGQMPSSDEVIQAYHQITS
jgi:heptosyltransferase-1